MQSADPAFMVIVGSTDHPLIPPAQIIENPSYPGRRMSLDEAREIMEACLFAAGQSLGASHRRAAARAVNAARSAQPGDEISLGPVRVTLRAMGVILQ